MRGRFTTPCSTSRAHVTAQVGGPATPRLVRRGEAKRGVVSGKSLARHSHMELVEMVDTWGLRSRWDRMSEPLCHASEASTATIHAEEVTGMREEADHGRKPDGRVRRVYVEPQPDDGTRVLVDRVWPRGLTKDKACLDLWFKQVTPSLLRKWYSHDPERFEAFGRRYREELKDERAHAPKTCGSWPGAGR
jgi:hypothetical protein